MGTVVTAEELEARTIRRTALVSCNQAFIDCRTPGSDTKENYALVGPGVSQSSEQFINLREPHGYNIGAAAMPNGVTNNLHLHFTAEVFFNSGGDWLFRWGVDGKAGEYLSGEGDIISMPTWIYRGFTNVGADDGWLFTALGRDDTGGIIWGPTVLREAAGHGLYLTADNQLVDTVAGQPLPSEDELVRPMPDDEIATLRAWSPEQMRRRIVQPDDLAWSTRPFLCSALDGGRAEQALVIGFGMTEDRDAEPPVYNPHGFNVSWLRAAPGEGLLRHRHSETQVLVVKDGEWEVTLNEGATALTVRLGPSDTFSVPADAWRSFRNVSGSLSRMVVVNGSDGRVHLDWAPEVVKAARAGGVAFDANGYVARAALVARATLDD